MSIATAGVALVCVTLLVGVGVGADRAVTRAAWTSRSPRPALHLWHAMAATTLTCIAALLLLPAHDVLEHGLLLISGATKPDLHRAYAGSTEVLPAWNLVVLGLPILLLTALRLGALARGRDRRERRAALSGTGRQVQVGAVAVRLDPRPGLSAFSLPAQRLARRSERRLATVVLSQEACLRLSRAQLEACFQHELAHLDRRHHRAVALAELLTRMGRPLGLLTHYETEVRRLVELEADDVAARASSRRDLAEALLTMSAGPLAPAGLAAAADDVVVRVTRLTGPTATADLGPIGRAVLTAVPLVPLLLVVLPGAIARLAPGHLP